MNYAHWREAADAIFGEVENLKGRINELETLVRAPSQSPREQPEGDGVEEESGLGDDVQDRVEPDTKFSFGRRVWSRSGEDIFPTEE